MLRNKAFAPDGAAAVELAAGGLSALSLILRAELI
jgi:hypothetical protein